MRRLAFLLVALALVLAAPASARVISSSHWTARGASVAAASSYVGKVLIHCSTVTQAQVDPIKSFGVTSSAHLHTSFGAALKADGSPIFNANTVPSDMTAAGSTTSCNAGGLGLESDHNLFWVPPPETASGTPVPFSASYYLLNNGYNVSRAPNGLRFISGDPAYRGAFGAGIFQCTQSNGAQFQQHYIPPASTGCTSYQETVYSPGQCWYPAGGLGQGMGGNGSPAVITGDDSTTCAGNGGVQIPRIEIFLTVGGAGVGGKLSSDTAGTSYPGESAHFDGVIGFLNDSVGQDALTKLDNKCLNQTTFPLTSVSCVDQNSTVYKAANTIGWPDTSQPVTTGVTFGASLSATPTTVARGGTVTASWSNPDSSFEGWIRAFVPGTADSTSQGTNWEYADTCTQTAGTAPFPTSASCSFTMPTTPGTYELRLLKSGVYSSVAKSQQITVG